MQATISLDSLWQLIRSLPLDNQKWLENKLQSHLSAQEETEYIRKEEVLAGIDAGLKDLKLLKEGKIKSTSFDDFLEDLKHEGKNRTVAHIPAGSQAAV